MIELIKLLYFMLPAYMANLTPALFKNVLKKWNYPVDFNKKLFGKPILGSHKTIKGIFAGLISAILTAYLQYKFYLKEYSLISYDNWFLIGFLLGFGALFGDCVKSFFKRRLSIKAGKQWIPFDQTDFTIGALVFSSFVYFPGLWNAVLIVLLSAILHVIVNYTGYLIGFKTSKL